MNLFRIIFTTAFIFCINVFGADSYYRLDDFDASYHKLKDGPTPPEKRKKLPPSSIYTQNRPGRIIREPDYDRKEITPNNQALIRIGKPPKKRQHFLFLGANTGVDLFSLADDYQAKKHIAVELLAKIGYLYYFNTHSTNALRIYLNIGSRFPTNKAISNNLAFSGNFDFLIDLFYLDFFLGGGYGGEYFFKDKFLSYGAHINLGISKSFGRNQIECGVVIPFYKFFIKDSTTLNHNIDFILSYHYKF